VCEEPEWVGTKTSLQQRNGVGAAHIIVEAKLKAFLCPRNHRCCEFGFGKIELDGGEFGRAAWSFDGRYAEREQVVEKRIVEEKLDPSVDCSCGVLSYLEMQGAVFASAHVISILGLDFCHGKYRHFT